MPEVCVFTQQLAPGSPPTHPSTPGEMVVDGDTGRERGGRKDLWWVIGSGRGRRRLGITGRGQKCMEG